MGKMKTYEQPTNKDLFIYSHLKEIKKAFGRWMNKEHYNIIPLLEKGCEYSIGYGEKSNGKSTAVQMLAVIINVLYGVQTVLLRCYDEDFKKGRADKMFAGVPSDFIVDVTKGEYDTIIYKNFKWYLARFDEKNGAYILAQDPFCFRVSILNAGSSFQFPNVEMIFYDEFITRQGNYPNEFVDFQTVLSTIIRLKSSVQIFLMGNTVNYYSVYFEEMGLYNIRNQKQGTIDVYEMGVGGSRIAVEYTDTIPDKKKSNKYFAFNNPKLEMITNGSWQLNLYPHLVIKYRPKDIKFTYYILFDKKSFVCEVINKENNYCMYIRHHLQTDKNIDFDKDIIYMLKEDTRPNISKDIFTPFLPVNQKILSFFVNNKVFYETNAIGDTIKAFIKASNN